MSDYRLTFYGMYNFLEDTEEPLFSKMELPEGIDKDVIVDTLLLKAGDFEVLYPNPYFFRDMIGSWSKRWSRTFNKWKAALDLEYSPIENYDRYEDVTENRDVVNESSQESQTENIDTKSAYDSASYQPYEKTNAFGSAGSNSSTDDNLHRVSHLHGNIGVTTSQQMLESELSISEWNLYEHISDLFINEFLIQTY